MLVMRWRKLGGFKGKVLTDIKARALARAACCCICWTIWFLVLSEELKLEPEPPSEREDIVDVEERPEDLWVAGVRYG